MRLLYETTGRASEVLSLDVEDVDLENGRAVVRSKGGAIEWLHFQTGCALLLPRLIAGRAWRPVFLTDRRPAPARTPAVVDDARQVSNRATVLSSLSEAGDSAGRNRHVANVVKRPRRALRRL